MINTRKQFEKLNLKNASYTSFMQQKIRANGIWDYKVTHSLKVSKNGRRIMTFYMHKEDWEKIIGGLKDGGI